MTGQGLARRRFLKGLGGLALAGCASFSDVVADEKQHTRSVRLPRIIMANEKPLVFNVVLKKGGDYQGKRDEVFGLAQEYFAEQVGVNVKFDFYDSLEVIPASVQGARRVIELSADEVEAKHPMRKELEAEIQEGRKGRADLLAKVDDPATKKELTEFEQENKALEADVVDKTRGYEGVRARINLGGFCKIGGRDAYLVSGSFADQLSNLSLSEKESIKRKAKMVCHEIGHSFRLLDTCHDEDTGEYVLSGVPNLMSYQGNDDGGKFGFALTPKQIDSLRRGVLEEVK